MRPLTESEHDRIFLESNLEEPSIPIFVDPDLEAIEDFELAGEAEGWRRGNRQIVLRESAIDRLDDQQLRGLVAHEISHHRLSHVLKSKIWMCLMASVVLIVFLAGMISWWITLNLWVLAALVTFLTLSIPAVMLSSAAISRRQELDADRHAVELLGTSEPLEALREPAAAAPRPRNLREWWRESLYPWPREEKRLAALDREE